MRSYMITEVDNGYILKFIYDDVPEDIFPRPRTLVFGTYETLERALYKYLKGEEKNND